MRAHVTDQLQRGEALSPSEELHVAQCAACQATAAEERRLDERLRAAAGSLASIPLPDRLVEQHLAVGPSVLAWAPVAALVLAVAVAVGLGIGSGLSHGGPSSSPSGSLIASSSPSASSSARPPSAIPTTSASAAPGPIAGVPADLVAGPAKCANGTIGFEMWIPVGWFANAAGPGGAACTYAAPVLFDPVGASRNPLVTVRAFSVSGDLARAEAALESKEVLERATMTVGGLPALRELGRGGAGQRLGYAIALDGATTVGAAKSFLVVATRPGSDAFERDAAALTAMLERFARLAPLTTSRVAAEQADVAFAQTAACATEQYGVSYPASWFTSGSGCEFFGPQPLASGSGDAAPDGTAVSLRTLEGAVGFTDVTFIARESLAVADRPATRFEVEDADGDRSYRYIVQLGPTEETGPNVLATVDARGDAYDINRAVLDRMMASLRIGSAHAADLRVVTDSDLSGSLTAVGIGSGQIIAGGSLCSADAVPDCNPAIWRSEDGTQWSTAVLLPKLNDNASVRAVVNGRDGWVAAGDGLWFSPDGASWKPASIALDPAGDGGPLYDGGSEQGCCGIELHDVVATPSGWVLVGGVTCFKCGYRAAIWLSSDGRSWQRVRYTPAFEGATMHSVHVLRDGRLVAAGGQDIWSSDDEGHTWTVRRVFPAEQSVVLAVSEDGEQLWAVSSSPFGDDGKLWTSTDGASWTSREIAGLANHDVRALAVVHGTMYLSTADATEPAAPIMKLFQLTDEGVLQPVTVEGGSAASISAMAATPTRLIAVGRVIDDPNRRAGVWLGP